MDARLFYTFALKLANDPAVDAAGYRSAISRAYYAAYNVAVAFLADVGYEPLAGPQGHQAVKNALLNCSDVVVKRVGSHMDTLHQERLAADYRMDLVKPENQAQAGAVATQAGRVITDLDACRIDPARRGRFKNDLDNLMAAGMAHGLAKI